jgi:hypothetical protein
MAQLFIATLHYKKPYKGQNSHELPRHTKGVYFETRDFEELSLVSSNAGRIKPSYIVSSDQPVFSSEPHSGQDNDFNGTSAPQFGQYKIIRHLI